MAGTMADTLDTTADTAAMDVVMVVQLSQSQRLMLMLTQHTATQ